MTFSKDLERVQSKSLRRRKRQVRESALNQNVSETHENDLARSVDANLRKSKQKAKIDRLRRSG